MCTTAATAKTFTACCSDELIPLYYQRDRDGLPRGWIKRMKRTIRTLGWRFNADRMVMDYTLKCYIPAAGGTFKRDQDAVLMLWDSEQITRDECVPDNSSLDQFRSADTRPIVVYVSA